MIGDDHFDDEEIAMLYRLMRPEELQLARRAFELEARADEPMLPERHIALIDRILEERRILEARYGASGLDR